MAFDLANFIDDLAKHLRGGSADAGTPRALWSWTAPEGVANGKANTASAYTVLAPYPGGSLPANVPLQLVSLQLMTTGPQNDAIAAVRQAQGYYDRFLDAQQRPARGIVLDRFVVQAVLNLRGPGTLGLDDKQRLRIVTNLDAQVYATE